MIFNYFSKFQIQFLVQTHLLGSFSGSLVYHYVCSVQYHKFNTVDNYGIYVDGRILKLAKVLKFYRNHYHLSDDIKKYVWEWGKILDVKD